MPKSVGEIYLVAIHSPLTETPKEYIKRVIPRSFDFATIEKMLNCESGWNPKARHLNPNGTWDIGLWQINDIHGLSAEDRMNVYKSTEYAIKLMQSKRGLDHWTCNK